MNQIRKLAKLLLPPIVSQGLRKIQSASRSGSRTREGFEDGFNLFDNEPNFLEDEIKNCSIYGEYGTGVSTQFALKFSNANVICVDNDPYWLSQATKNYSGSERLNCKIVDLGKTLSWGVPVGAARMEQYLEYTNWIMTQENVPDLVLVDGRLRVCCFLTSLKFLPCGARIIFDDYVNRPQYHFVEKFLAPKNTRGRQALFEIPNKNMWDEKDLTLSIDAFRCNLN